MLRALIRGLAKLLAPLKLRRYPIVRSLYRATFGLFVRGGRARVQHAGYDMVVDPHDNGVGYQLFIGRPYEPLTTQLFEELVGEGDRVLDLGANVGYFSLLAARQVGAGGRVFAFEPEPDNFALLEETARRNDLAQLVPVQRACSDEAGEVILHLADRGKGLHTMGDVGGEWEGIPIEAVRVDQFLGDEEPFDFVKMDIEGAETRAFRGMEGLLARRSRVGLLAEVHPRALERAGSSVEEFVDLLLASGFEITHVVDEVAETDEPLERDALVALCARRPLEVKDWSCNVFFARGERS